MSKKTKPSKIVLDERFESEDNGFLPCLREFEDYQLLLHFTGRWLSNQRPWARRQLIRYIDGVWDSPGHEVIVKRVFKHAEAENDVELLTHFFVALDQLVRRSRVRTWSYNWRTRRSTYRERLHATPNRTVREQRGRTHTYSYGRRSYTIPLPDIVNKPGNRLFSQATRAHLRRRVWRYFRRLAYQDQNAYVDAMCDAWRLYLDQSFESGEAILDNWSLVHSAYYGSDVLAFTVAHCNVVAGKSLTQLRAAPYRPTAWQAESAGQKLWSLMAEARSVLVRRLAIELLEDHHAEFCESIPIDELLTLLAHSDSAIQEFAVARFSGHPDLPRIGIDVWLRLIDGADVAVLPTVCSALREHVSAERLSTEQLIDLTLARRHPAAQLGFEWLQQRHGSRPLTAEELIRLAEVNCQALAGDVCDWALAELSANDVYETDHVLPFFDSLNEAVRSAACRWLLAEESVGAVDAVLWAKLTESPADDVRFALIELLRPLADQAFSGRPQMRQRSGTFLEDDQSIMDVARVWSAVILCVDRGNRFKPKAIRQLAAAIESSPELAERFLPTLAVAARSIRGPEQQAAIAALARLGEHSTTTQAAIRAVIPELEWVR